MKIAIFTPEYISEDNNWHGGLANYLGRITLGLTKRGHEVHVLTLSDSEKIKQINGVTVHGVVIKGQLFWFLNKLSFGLLHDSMQMLFIAFAFKKYFYSIKNKYNFDCLHSSSCQTPCLLFNSKKIGIPIVTRLSSITRLCHIVAGRRNRLDMYFLNLFEKILAIKSDKVFAPSLLTKSKTKREFGRDVDLLEPPAYVSSFSLEDEDTSVYDCYLGDKKYLLFFGTLSRLKGSEFIANVLYDFLKINKDFYFVFVGKMSPLNRNKIPMESLLKEAREFKNKIIYTSSLRHKFLVPIIRRSQAVVLPSIFDNLPNTLIESMSLGKIVVGTNDSRFDQLIEDGKNGFLLDFGDRDKFLKVLNYVCALNDEEKREIESKAKETIHRKLDFNKKIIELEKYYQKAIYDFQKNQ